LHVSFSNVAVKLTGSDAWIAAQKPCLRRRQWLHRRYGPLGEGSSKQGNCNPSGPRRIFRKVVIGALQPIADGGLYGQRCPKPAVRPFLRPWSDAARYSSSAAQERAGYTIIPSHFISYSCA
jgi:hypothetical protein